MKQKNALLILALFAVQLAAYWVLPLVQLGSAKQQSAAHIASKAYSHAHETRAFTFSLADFKQKKAGKREFWQDGVLHDIVTVAYFSDSIRLTAYADTHEQWVVEQLAQHFQLNAANPSHSRHLPNLFAQLFAMYILPAPGILPLFPQPPPTLVKSDFVYQGRFLNGFSGVFVPPPEQVFG